METISFDATAPSPAPAGFGFSTSEHRVASLRQRALAGIAVTLTPYESQFAESLRALRSRPENQFNLAQAGALTLEQQHAWGIAYQARADDICWIVLTPTGEFAGATRLYDIDHAAGQAEKGGLVLREELARTAPLALESELILLHVAFTWLGLRRLVTRVRPENTKMISLNARLGFRPAGSDTLRGVPYGRFALAASEFDPAPLVPILHHWKNRHAR
jgi:RimJ/RimL family protein N-acetyltransferase